MIKTILFITLLSTALSQYRYISSQQLSLPNSQPQYIDSLSQDMLVIKYGKNISLYNTTTNKIQQTFTSSSDNAQIAVCQYLGMAVIKENGELVEMQKRSNMEIVVNTNNCDVSGLGVYGNNIALNYNYYNGSQFRMIFVSTGEPKSISYFGSSQKQFNNLSLGASPIMFVSPYNYYFVAGFATSYPRQFVLFNGTQYTLKPLQCLFNNYISNKTQKLQLTINYQPQPSTQAQPSAQSSVNQYLQPQQWAITYKKNPQDPTLTSNYIINSTNNPKLQGQNPFHVVGQQSMSYVDGLLYIFDNNLCRITRHTPQYYSTDSYPLFQNISTSVRYTVSQDCSRVLITNGGQASLYRVLSSGYLDFKTKVIFDWGVIAKKAYMAYASQYLPVLVILSQKGQLYSLKSGASSLSRTNYTDICLISDKYLYILNTNDTNSQVYGMYMYPDMSKFTLFSLILPYKASSIQCLSNYRVLVNPTQVGDYFQIWEYDEESSSAIPKSRMRRQAKIHDKVYRTKQLIYFVNQDNNQLRFYDSSLKPVQLSNSIIVGVDQVIRIVPSATDDIFVAIGKDLDHLDVLDYYRLQYPKLIYKGSYPLTNSNTDLLANIFILTNKNIVSITHNTPDYQQSKLTYIYKFDNAPQQMYAHLTHHNINGCANYSHVLMRKTQNNSKHIMAINKQRQPFLLEVYEFGGVNGSAVLVDSVDLKNMDMEMGMEMEMEMEMKFGDSNRLVMVSGVYGCDDRLCQVTQVRNCSNLSHVLYFENLSYPNQTTQTYSMLSKYNIYLSYTTPNQTTITSSPISFLKLSLPLPNIHLFSLCRNCPKAALTTTPLSSTLYIVDIGTQTIQRQIQAKCAILQLMYTQQYTYSSGFYVLYRCQNSSLYLIDAGRQTKVLDDVQELVDCFSVNMYDVYVVVVVGGVLKTVQIMEINAMQQASEHTMQQASGDPMQQASGDNTRQLARVNTRQQTRQKQVIVSQLHRFNTEYQHGTIATNKRDYAIIANPTTIHIYNRANTLVTTFTLPQPSSPISSIFFNSTNLHILTKNNTLITLASTPCSKYQNNINGYCVCLQTFILKDGECVCASEDYVLVGQRCVCVRGMFQEERHCVGCSVFCVECNSAGLFQCVRFDGVMMGVFVGGCVVGVGLLLVVAYCVWKRRIRRRQANKQGNEINASGRQHLVEDKESLKTGQ